jgi:hypothetical protein
VAVAEAMNPDIIFVIITVIFVVAPFVTWEIAEAREAALRRRVRRYHTDLRAVYPPKTYEQDVAELLR